jgi:hypothetical protein
MSENQSSSKINALNGHIDYKAIRELSGTGTPIRAKAFHCGLCHGGGKVLANLTTGKLLGWELPTVCHWPARCPERVARGIFDRQFGETLIHGTYPQV